jgi:hypothetical protein
VIGAIATVFGAVLLYARHELFAPEAFADHAAAALDEETVRTALAPAIVTAIGNVSPEGPPTTQQVVKALADPRVSAAFGASAAVATRQLFNGGSKDLDLELDKVAEIALARSNGTTPDELGISPSDLESARLHLIGAKAVLDTLDSLEQISWLGFVITPMGVLALLLSIPLAPDALRGLSSAALAVAVVAALSFVALYVGREVVSSQFHDEITRDAVSDAWGAVLGGLRTGLLVVAAASVVVALGAGAAASRRNPAW